VSCIISQCLQVIYTSVTFLNRFEPSACVNGVVASGLVMHAHASNFPGAFMNCVGVDS
jgi:hypothetical protein